MAKSIMIQGTMSNAGKSLICAGLCRIFKQDGYKVAPFKSQNMALNSYITDDGLEMGRAQVVQAEAAGVSPDVLMNPILLKPVTDMGSQVIVRGEVVGNYKAMDYYAMKKKLKVTVQEAYDSLAEQYDIIVIEGAGSPAEINLKADDIVNMGMAKMANAPVLLVGDIDRGGVFAQLYGTVKLLDEDEQDIIKGTIINKFRGDIKLLEGGLRSIEELTNKPVLGVVPMMQVDIDDEDSLSQRLATNINKSGAIVDVAVVRLPKISNFTDFYSLEAMKEVNVRYISRPSELLDADIVIIPGTKSTISDLQWLKDTGFDKAIINMANNGKYIIGICGGYQMLGESIIDEIGAENDDCKKSKATGLSLLPMITIFENNKTRTKVSGTIVNTSQQYEFLKGALVNGYEIHMGISKTNNSEYSISLDGKMDGTMKGSVMGTYLHGFFDSVDVRKRLVDHIAKSKGISVISDCNIISLDEYKDNEYNKLADYLRASLDMDKIYKIMGIER